jgi:hypothetical protein
MAAQRNPLSQRTEPCGCVVKEYFGHTNTLLCERHQREHFGIDLVAVSFISNTAARVDNSDLIS